MNKILAIVIGFLALLSLPFLIYYFSPVPYSPGIGSICKDVMPPIGGCFQFCSGVPITKCETSGERQCISSCKGQCYGSVSGTCVEDNQKKKNPLDFIKSSLHFSDEPLN